ncbi:hypothetical protein MUN89_07825 [Halobacillus salinarum]|uniref:Uncharacterized protein n=1 Tax=Halobacillus salinarum TaxID=2932257 RepID=A0ABY4EQ88_9BACI|nr:hypothetical protein [Halobacillus salinarum]UOQ45827.1 hypothetical protein MUN89_07825 [Halobacillus salinarum]
MMWLLLLIPAAIITVAIYFEKRGKREAQEANLSMKDRTMLEQDYIEHGAGNEASKPENL